MTTHPLDLTGRLTWLFACHRTFYFSIHVAAGCVWNTSSWPATWPWLWRPGSVMGIWRHPKLFLDEFMHPSAAGDDLFCPCFVLPKFFCLWRTMPRDAYIDPQVVSKGFSNKKWDLWLAMHSFLHRSAPGRSFTHCNRRWKSRVGLDLSHGKRCNQFMPIGGSETFCIAQNVVRPIWLMIDVKSPQPFYGARIQTQLTILDVVLGKAELPHGNHFQTFRFVGRLLCTVRWRSCVALATGRICQSGLVLVSGWYRILNLLIDGLMYLSRNWLAGVLYAQIQWPFIFDPALRQVASLHHNSLQKCQTVCRYI